MLRLRCLTLWHVCMYFVCMYCWQGLLEEEHSIYVAVYHICVTLLLFQDARRLRVSFGASLESERAVDMLHQFAFSGQAVREGICVCFCSCVKEPRLRGNLLQLCPM